MRALVTSVVIWGAALVVACDSDEEAEEVMPSPTAIFEATPEVTLSPTPTATGPAHSPYVPPTTSPEFFGAIEAARAKWDAAAIRSYRYDLTVGCFCATDRPVHVTVQDGLSVSITRPSGDKIPIDDIYYELYSAYSTIERAFESTLAAMQDEDRVVLELTFDDTLGFPNHSYSDYLLATDGQFLVDIENFEVMP